MSDQNVCPYCGGEDIVAVWIRDAKYGEIRLKDTPAALCHRCKTVGPYAANEAAAIHAFTHPAHLLKDKALVDVDDLTEVLSILEDANNPAIDRLWAQMREGRVK